jgi:hypothetical protein
MGHHFDSTPWFIGPFNGGRKDTHDKIVAIAPAVIIASSFARTTPDHAASPFKPPLLYKWYNICTISPLRHNPAIVANPPHEPAATLFYNSALTAS